MMTERAYFLYLIGNKDLELKDARIERQKLWMQLCSYADPNKMPKTIFDFMPLVGDPEKRQISSKEIMQADQLFRNLGKKQ